MSDRVRVRYAPSPTGYLHIGNARTALFNYLFAKHYDGDFVIRIEDTDSKRNLVDGESSQFDNLKWLGIEWDESVDKDKGYGPYRQSERVEFSNRRRTGLDERSWYGGSGGNKRDICKRNAAYL